MADPESIRTLLRQAARWTVAAEQDSNPLIGVLHANYGMAYVTALRQIATDQEIEAVTGEDMQAVEAHVAAVQDQAVRRFAPHCPTLLPSSPLAGIAGEGEAPRRPGASIGRRRRRVGVRRAGSCGLPAPAPGYSVG